MPATPLIPSNRYFPPGTRKYNWLPAIANTSSPTRAEINAGTDLTAEIATVNGFQLASSISDVTPLGAGFIQVIPTLLDASASGAEFIFYASSNSIDVRTLLPKGTAGFVLFLPEGDAAGRMCEVWPATVSALFFDPATETPGEIHVQFTITSQPVQNVTIPA